MKAEKIKKGILRAVLTVLLVGALFLGGLWNFTAPISATAAAPSSLTDVTEEFYFGLAPGITDPTKVTTDKGYYYKPEAYVYFGAVYNSATAAYEPIICRVLDANADNTGAGGAMFVLTENAIRANDKFASAHETANDYIDFENIYSFSAIKNTSSVEALFQGSDYIRPITKTDVLANMSGAFGYTPEYGYHWETDSLDGDYNVISADEATLLDNSRLFPLSVEELLLYVGNYNGAPGMSATHAPTKASVAWWLRTGFNDAYGNLVGGVDANGKVVPVSAEDMNVAGRYAFNIETEDISYTQHLGNNVYKLAFNSPTYKNTDTPFAAEVADVKDGILTVKYSNYVPNSYFHEGKTAYVSMVIQDSEGNVKYYGSIEAVREATDGDVVKTGWKTASFVLPEGYSEGDTVSVFWEKKYDRLDSISYTSNMVKLDCIHTAGAVATCTSLAICEKCGQEYGSLDSENHSAVGEELYYDDETDTHWNVCDGCGEQTNIESCTFGALCTSLCECGNIDITYSMHHFDETGVCIYDKTHFDSPIRIARGFMSDFEIHNEGQLITFAKYVNTIAENGLYNEYGEGWGYPNIISLKADLDFTDIAGFVPIGSEENQFSALIFDGNDHTIRGIDYDANGAYVGLFGVVEDTFIENIKLTDCSFTGTSGVSALIGKATGVEVSYVTVDGVTLNTTEGCVGSVMAVSDETSKIGYSISYGVLTADGLNVPFTSDGNAVIDYSYCLAEEHNAERGEMTSEQFASGELGYIYSQLHTPRGKFGGQEIGVDRYPYFGGKTVYMAMTCDGVTVYFNDRSLKEEIEAHNYTAFAEEEPTFIWEPTAEEKIYDCFVSAVCGDCDHVGMAEADVVMDYSRVPVRGDWTATITLGGVTKTESKTEIGILIQDMIGMTGIVKDFDGVEVWPEDLMNNHRLNDGSDIYFHKEYEVYFVNSVTGEEYFAQGGWNTATGDYDYSPTYVMAAGTYDLVVIGKNDYEGQSYTYEGVLVINPITVTVSPLDVYKHYDCNSEFRADYTLDNENADGEWFDVVLGNSSSADVGEYSVGVSIRYNTWADNYKPYKDSVILVLERENVNAVILPALRQSVENKNYPTEFTYGDTIPTPVADNFTVNGNGELSFEWYKVEYEYYGAETSAFTAVDGIPADVGDYILRVRVAATESLLAAYADFEITINKKELRVQITVPEGTESVKIGYINYYMVDSIDDVKVSFVDFDYNAFDAVGLSTYAQFNLWEIDSERLRNCYNVEYYAILENAGITPSNYHVYSDSICLSLPADEDSFVRDITMWVKECSVDLSSPEIEFDIRNIVMKAGEVFLLGHTLTDVKLVIDRDKGEIRVSEFKVVDENGNDVSSLYRSITYISNWSHADGGNNVVHIFDNSCDTDCNVAGCTFKRTSHHTGGVATCTMPAICTACNELYGEVNEYHHTHTGTVIIPNPENYLTHLVLHSCCGEVEKVAEHTPITPATCTERAKCAVCGWSYGELDPTNHSSLECSYTPDAENANNHLKTHICCGAVESELHSGGEATCIVLASCEHCNTPYGELDLDNHAELPTIVPDEEDSSIHNISYACCDFVTSEAHSGGEASCIAVSICDKCGEGYGEKNPENHASDTITYLIREDNASMHDLYHSCCQEYIDKEYHTGGVATCASAALCEHCGALYGTIDPSNHSSDEYSYTQNPSDDNKHLKVHACCGKEISDEEHSGGEANCLHGTLCEYCGVDYGEKTDHAYDNSCDAICNVCGELTRALSFHADDDDNKLCDVCGSELPDESLSGGAISAIATSSAVVAGLGGSSLLWFVIKKKSWSALLKLLLG
ncbi:MAG: hypothetical protein IJ386_02875 [Clostridia bacterium]|nr:hypothetical protein [Clostridia bacterium]